MVPPMYVVFDEETERKLIRLVEASDSGTQAIPVDLTATLVEDEGLIVVKPPGLGPGALWSDASAAISCYAARLATYDGPDFQPTDPTPTLLLGVSAVEPSPPRAFLYEEDKKNSEECHVEVVRPETDVFSRLKGIFDTRLRAPMTVGVIGLGSGGSIGAVELAKSSVGGFILIDFDRLKAHNISRHACGLADVGRFKTRAVRDAILQHNPTASVQ
ncbi:MAG: ThiF family adenylyltransferase [SAR202 cluster bacterium]|nr:ThiF family adenylyltransferase [SAR202 cluster bacterium]